MKERKKPRVSRLRHTESLLTKIDEFAAPSCCPTQETQVRAVLFGISEDQYCRIRCYGENEQNYKNFKKEHYPYPEAESENRCFFPIIANKDPDVFKPFSSVDMPFLLTPRPSKLRYAINKPTNQNSHLKIVPGITRFLCNSANFPGLKAPFVTHFKTLFLGQTSLLSFHTAYPGLYLPRI